MSWFWVALGVLAFWAAVVVMRRRREELRDAPSKTPGLRARGASARDDEIDYEALEEAEREVKDLDTDAKGRPLDEGLGDDWGPGTPKPPYV
jgi:hypothetical protein